MANNLPNAVFQENFERGTKGNFTTETDVEGILNYPHYTTLSRHDVTYIGAIAPWRGAYCMEINLGGDANDHTLIVANIVADTKLAYARFMFFLGKDFAATADDTFNIFEVQSAAAVQGVIGLRITAATGVVEIGTGKVAPTVFAAQPLVRGRWYCLELVSDIETGGTGTETLWVDNTQAAQVTTITNIALTTTALGVRNALSTTSGHMFYDQVVYDDNEAAPATQTRIGMPSDRYPETVFVSQSTHLALGQSELLNVTLLPGTSTDSVLKIYDTDNASIQDDTNVVATLFNLTANEPPIDLADVPVVIKRGAYIQLSGTGTAAKPGPAALIHIGKSQAWGGHGRVRQHGYNKGPASLQVTQ